MGSISGKNDNNTVSAKEIKYRCTFSKKHDTILFSFKYITNQKEYNLSRFKKSNNLRNDILILNEFHECLNTLCLCGWEQLRVKNKYQGGRELMDYSQIYISAHDPNDELKLTKDSKCIIIRFGGNKYRLIGYRSKLCPSIFHIIGFDFSFNAYNHGS